MAKIGAAEITLAPTKEIATALVKEEAHPYAFHVSGPRNVASPNWRDLINSSWSVLIMLCCFVFFFSPLAMFLKLGCWVLISF